MPSTADHGETFVDNLPFFPSVLLLLCLELLMSSILQIESVRPVER